MIHLSKEKPKLGKLIRVFPSGKTQVLESNKPWPVLQKIKAKYIRLGYRKENLKVTYLDIDKKSKL